MNCGLRQEDINYIIAALIKLPEIEKAAIFGSRAKGNNKPGSDVDLAIWGQGITFTTVSHLHFLLEDESPMPYFFDIVDYTHLTHEKLKGHINRVSKVIYNRSRH
ncbi:nucleotidyltransferase domain-containing protein [Candidatus Desantisbacteria bacterium]|nr:nucleotidyltransferase domain-containing protein [Candidatus Desantisbacteria bacterium]